MRIALPTSTPTLAPRRFAIVTAAWCIGCKKLSDAFLHPAFLSSHKMYHHIIHVVHRHPHKHSVPTSSSTSTHHPCIHSPAVVSRVPLCQTLSPIRVQERSRIGRLHPRSTVVYASCVRLWTRAVLGVPVVRLDSGTGFLFLANTVPKPFIHILPYAFRPSFAHLLRIASRDEPGPFIVPDPIKVAAFVLSYSSRLLYILPRPRRQSALPIPLRIVSYHPFSHPFPVILVNVAASEPTITVVVLSLKGSPHCSAQLLSFTLRSQSCIQIILLCTARRRRKEAPHKTTPNIARDTHVVGRRQRRHGFTFTSPAWCVISLP